MASKILTPVTLWEEFSLTGYKQNLINESTVNGTTIREVYLYRKCPSGADVRIYVKMAYAGAYEGKSTIFYIPDAGEEILDEHLLSIVELGYVAFSMDISGDNGKTKEVNDELSYSPFTAYPDSIKYAKWSEYRSNPCYIGKSAKETAYYQWSVNARYVLDYIRSQSVGSIAVMAKGASVTTAFHLGATEKLSALVALYGCGWIIPLGNKYGENVKVDYAPDELKFVAGLEAQSYSAYLKCPTLMCVTTNNPKYDIDRAYDTFTRIREDVYSAIVYTVGLGNYLSNKAFRDVKLFLNKYLDKIAMHLPNEIFTDAKIIDKKINVSVTYDGENADRVHIFASEGVIEPEYRCWKKIASFDPSDKTKKCEVEFSPVQENGIVFFYSEIAYKNGFTVSSPLVVKRFSKNEVKCVPQFNVVYSCKEKYKEGIFEGINTNVKTSLYMKTVSEPVVEKVGAFGINGVDASRGIYTFNVLKPTQDAMFMIDVYSQLGAKVTIDLVVNALTDSEKVYSVTVDIEGGNLWHKLQFEMAKFKTKEGFSLKSYENVKAIKIHGDNEFIVNNLMWI